MTASRRAVGLYALTGLALALGVAGCGGDPAVARTSSDAVSSTRAWEPYDCPRDLPFDTATGLVPPEGSRVVTEAELREAEIAGFTSCEWQGNPPRSISSADRERAREMQTGVADRIGEPFDHDMILEGVLYVFQSTDGTTYFAGSAMNYGPGDVIEVIYALDL